MGSSKKVTVGYWYHPIIHLGLHQGPMDAFLRLNGGEVNAWAGTLTESGTIQVNAGAIWGGEEAEGGMEGAVDVMFGEADQLPNPDFQTLIGPDPSAHRGIAALFWKGGRYGAMNPYPKPLAAMTRRILKGWAGDEPWYPEKAPIPMASVGRVLIPDTRLDGNSADNTATTFREVSGLSPADVVIVDLPPGQKWAAWSPWSADDSLLPTPPPVPGKTWTNYFRVTSELGTETYLDDNTLFATAIEAFDDAQLHLPIQLTGSSFYRFWLYDPNTGDNRDGLSLRVSVAEDLIAMNPAHMILDSIIDPGMQGEPIELVNLESFTAAADRLFDEGFGLCTDYDPDSETVEEFRQRLCNVIAARCTRSTIDNRWNLVLIRPVEDIEALPILTDDDILEFKLEPSVIDDAVNQVSVRWFDPMLKQERTTSPVNSLGAIAAMGTIVPQTLRFPEIPVEGLAQRVAARELLNRSTPLARLTLTTNRKPYDWLLGNYFRVQAPEHGITDMVCLLADIDKGTLRSGAISLVGIEDVFSMPESTYIVGEPPEPPESNLPRGIDDEEVFEASYFDLASRMPSADLAALEEPSAFMLAVAARPGVGQGYLLQVAPPAGEFADVASFDWTPTALVVEGCAVDELGRTAFTLADPQQLDRVAVGTAARWGHEVTRVDAIDAGTLEVTLARGCADTVPQQHPPGERIWFYDDWAGTDEVEYAAGETIEARMLTRTGSGMLDPTYADVLELEFAGRAAHPYPPGNFRVNGDAYPAAVDGDLVFTWSHRDRVQQADQLVDTTLGDVGTGAGQTYNLRIYNPDDVLLHEELGITGGTFTFTNDDESGSDVPSDPGWSDTVSYLQFDEGVDGATATTDLRPEVAWSFAGAAQIDTERKKFGASALLIAGTSDYVHATHASLNLSGGNYTVEGWGFYDSATYSGDRCLWSNFYSQSFGRAYLYVNSNGRLIIGEQDANGLNTATSNSELNAVPRQQWFKWSLVKDSGWLKAHINGAMVATIASANRTFAAHARIGRLDEGTFAFPWRGSMDSVRIKAGVALYPGSYTPETEPLPAGPSGVDGLNPSLRIELETVEGELVSLQQHDVIVRRAGYGNNYGYLYDGAP